MSPEKLVYMANQIGRFFSHRPHAQAVADIADHLRKFWEPRMRKAFFDHMDQGGHGLDPQVLQAGRHLRGETSDAPRHPMRSGS